MRYLINQTQQLQQQIISLMEKKWDHQSLQKEFCEQTGHCYGQRNQQANNYQQAHPKLPKFIRQKQNNLRVPPKPSIRAAETTSSRNSEENKPFEAKADYCSVTPLSKLKGLSLGNTLLIFSKILMETANFKKRGYSCQFLLEQWFINKGKNIQFVINLGQKSQYKPNKQQETVEQIVISLKTICGDKTIHDFIAFFNRAKSKYCCDFKFTLSLIGSYCLCSKITQTRKIQIVDQQSAKEVSSRLSKRTYKRFFESQPNSKQKHHRTKTLNKSCEQINGQLLKVAKSCERRSINKSRSKSRNKKIKFYNSSLSHENTVKNLPHFQKPDYSLSSKINKNSTRAGKSSQNSADFKSMTLNQTKRSDCIKSYVFKQKSEERKSPVSYKLIPTFKSANFKQLKPQNQQFEKNKQCQQNKPVDAKVSDSQEQDVLRKHHHQIFQNNKWKINFQNLSLNTKGLVQSYVDGKQEDYTLRVNNPETLGKLARMVVQSCMPNQPAKDLQQ